MMRKACSMFSLLASVHACLHTRHLNGYAADLPCYVLTASAAIKQFADPLFLGLTEFPLLRLKIFR